MRLILCILTYVSFVFLQLSVLFCITMFCLGLSNLIRMYEVEQLVTVGLMLSGYCTLNLIALALTKYILGLNIPKQQFAEETQ